MIKRGIYILWGIWCAFATLITPVWLTLTYLNLSGQIYKYDYSMDEGTAIVLGIAMVVIWILIALLPTVLLVRHIYRGNHKYAYVAIGAIILIILLCMVCYGGNIVRFLSLIDFI